MRSIATALATTAILLARSPLRLPAAEALAFSATEMSPFRSLPVAPPSWRRLSSRESSSFTASTFEKRELYVDDEAEDFSGMSFTISCVDSWVFSSFNFLFCFIFCLHFFLLLLIVMYVIEIFLGGSFLVFN